MNHVSTCFWSQFSLDFATQNKDDFDKSTTPGMTRSLYKENPEHLTDTSQPDGVCYACVALAEFKAGSLVATWRVLLPDNTPPDDIADFAVSRVTHTGPHA